MEKINKNFQDIYEKKIEIIYGKDKKDFEEYYYSSEDNSIISNSNFGMVEDENYIEDELKKNLNYIYKIKLNNYIGN